KVGRKNDAFAKILQARLRPGPSSSRSAKMARTVESTRIVGRIGSGAPRPDLRLGRHPMVSEMVCPKDYRSTARNPRNRLVLVGTSFSRLDERQFSARSFQLPPR